VLNRCTTGPSLERNHQLQQWLGVSITGYTDNSAALIAPYQRTLKHLILGDEDPTEMAVSRWTLPPWENYPHLVELAIDTVRTPAPFTPCPPPPGHPLRTFRIPKWDSRSIQAVLGQEPRQNHLERIIMTRLRWCESVVPPSDCFGAEQEDHHLQNDVMSIIQLCLERGVRLEDGLHQTAQDCDPATISWYQPCAWPERPDSWHTTETCTGKPPKED